MQKVASRRTYFFTASDRYETTIPTQVTEWVLQAMSQERFRNRLKIAYIQTTLIGFTSSQLLVQLGCLGVFGLKRLEIVCGELL